MATATRSPGRRQTENEPRALVIQALRGSENLRQFASANRVSVPALKRSMRRYLDRKLPQLSGTFKGPVGQEVEIVRDRWGVPHVFARTEADVYFGFGLAAGQDRLWQLDYRRRYAHGTLAEILGRSALASDRVARTLGFRQVAEAEMANHPEATRAALESFAAGVNQAIEAFGDELPPEFDVLDYRPAPWTPLDSVTISRASLWQFSGRVENIVIAEAAKRYVGSLAERFLTVEAPDETIVPASDEARTACRSGSSTASLSSVAPQGSNQWAVGPTMSATGAPLLASDGHVPLAQPSSIYEIHLSAGPLDVIGICNTPGVPTLSNGRTRHTAWGVTNNVSSVRDLYVETIDPGDSERVLSGDGSIALDRRVERIYVRGDTSVDLEVRRSPHGPIINELIPHVDPAGDPPLSLRWVGLEPHDSITWGIELARTKSAEEVRRAHRGWHLSGQNPGFADDQGHIGYQMRGGIPRRGRIVRGYRDPRNPLDDWDGMISFDDLPSMADPPHGWIGSSNQRPAPPEGELPLYGAYGDGYRGRRMRALIEGAGPYILNDMGRMQNDVYSERAASLSRRLADLIEGDLELADVVRTLRRWDCRFSVQSRGAAIFGSFWWRWTERVAAARFPEHLSHLAAGAVGAVAHDLIREGDFGWFGESTDLTAEARTAMREALDWLGDKLGPDRRRWTWGRLHPITLTHALSNGRPAFAEMFDIGPRPCPGTQGVLNQNGFRVAERFETTSGPHYRFLCDLADPSGAVGCNTAGSSGNPASPHYRDQLDDWLAGRYHRLSMDRVEVMANTEAVLTVVPAGISA